MWSLTLAAWAVGPGAGLAAERPAAQVRVWAEVTLAAQGARLQVDPDGRLAVLLDDGRWLRWDSAADAATGVPPQPGEPPAAALRATVDGVPLEVRVGERSLSGHDLATGRTLWEVVGDPMVAGGLGWWDGKLAVPRRSGWLDVLDPLSGARTDALPLALDVGPIAAVASLRGCVLVVPERAETDARCVAPDGVHWWRPLDGALSAAPMVDPTADGVMLGHAVGWVVGLAADGGERWRWRAPSAPTALARTEDGTRWVLHGDRLTGLRTGGASLAPAVAPRPQLGAVPYRAGAPAPDPRVGACRALDGAACASLAMEAPATVREGGLRLACRLGDLGACRQLAAGAGESAVEAAQVGCAARDAALCERWLEVVPAPQRGAAARAACAAGHAPACALPGSSSVPDAAVETSPTAAPAVPTRGTIRVDGAPAAGAGVWVGDELLGRADAAGELVVELPTSVDAVRVEHPLTTASGEVAVTAGRRFRVELTSPAWASVTVEPGAPAGLPGALAVRGCAELRSGLVGAGPHVVRGLGAGATCSFEATDDALPGRWVGQAVAAPGVDVTLRWEAPEGYRAIQAFDLDGLPLRDVRFGAWRTGADGWVVSHAPGAPCAGPGAFERFVGYTATCQVAVRPLDIRGAEEPTTLVAIGPTSRVLPLAAGEAHTLWLEPGAWILTWLGEHGERRQLVQLDRPRALAPPVAALPAPVLEVVDPSGRPLAGRAVQLQVEGQPLGPSRTTDLTGRVRAPGLQLPGVELRVDGRVVGVPRDGLVVLDPKAPPAAVPLRQGPLGLRLGAVDERWVELAPGGLLREACGHRVDDLAPEELYRLQAGRACDATLWRPGGLRRVRLPAPDDEPPLRR